MLLLAYVDIHIFTNQFVYSILLLGSEHLDPINVKIAELREALESIISEQKYLKARDARHRHSKLVSLVSCYKFVRFLKII